MRAIGVAMAATRLLARRRGVMRLHGRQLDTRWRRSAQYRSLACGSVVSPPTGNDASGVGQSECPILYSCTARSRVGRSFWPPGIVRTSVLGWLVI